MDNIRDNNIKVALMYDFDKTLCVKNMQEFGFIPDLNMQIEDFWDEVGTLSRSAKMDSVLAYMYLMVKKSAEKNTPIRREALKTAGRDVEFYNGLDTWFGRINNFAESLGATVEHYVISSGLKEIIQGTTIANEFKEIYACEFLYDDNGNAIWPVTAVNYTNKTQFVYRINKGVLDVSNDKDLNKSTPDDNKRIPFSNMVYIGDGLSDVPCMKTVKMYGGTSIAVYDNMTDRVADLLTKNRVDFIYPADYTQDSGLEITIKNIIRKIVVSQNLFNENKRQLAGGN